MKSCVIPILVLSLFAPSAATAADPPKGGTDPIAAERIFYEARTLMNQSRWSEACPKLEESLRLGPGLGTAFNLADCNEHLGKVMTAWAGFLDVATQARQTNQPDREKLARKRAQALEPRLPMLFIEVRSTTPGLTVHRDGVPIEGAIWNVPIPVDPGTHRVTASAPGRRTSETTVESTEGKTARVSVPSDLPVARVAATIPTRASSETATSTGSPETERAFPPAIVEKSATQRTVGWILTGVGAVGVGVGAGFGLSSISKRDESRDHCVGNVCDATGMVLRGDAIQNGTIATIATIAGGAAVVSGLIVVLASPTSGGSHPRTGTLRAVPNASIAGGGFTLQGAF
jgi:hypothetical protein